MGTGYIIKLLGFALLTIASLSSCSLDQRSIAGGMARIQLNTRSQTGGPARLATVSGVSLPTASSYYVIDVEGEGIPRQVIEPTRCVKASPLSSAMVPALVQAGETQRTEIELLVPVGANRKIRIIRVDLNIPVGSSMPMWAENPFGYKSRNPAYAVSGEMYVLAEADIPFLSGDQSVTLVEKATALPIQNQCNLGTMQPFIGNNDVELMNYEPWEGVNASGQPRPYSFWRDGSQPHHFVIRGELRNKTNSTLTPPGLAPVAAPSNNLNSFGYPNPIAGPLPGGAIGPQDKQFYQWIIPMHSPSPLPGPYSVNITFPYAIGGVTHSITQNFSARVIPVPPPISSPSPAVSVPGYANLFKSSIVFTRNGSMAPVRKWGSLVSMAASFVDMEPYPSKGLVSQFPATSISNVAAIATDPLGDNVFAASGTTIHRINSSGTSMVTTAAPATGLLVVGTKIVFVDQTAYLLAYDYTVASPTITTLYTGAAGTNFSGLALDPSGNLFLADPQSHVLYRLTAAQFQSALSGTAPTPGSAGVYAGISGTFGSTDGARLSASFKGPVSLASGPDGTLYVGDSGNASIRKISPAGVVSTLSPPVNGFGLVERVAWGAGSLLVSDSSRKVIFRLTSNGTFEVAAGQPGISGSLNLLAEDSLFSGPIGLGVDSNGTIFVGDSSELRRIDPVCPIADAGGGVGRAFIASRGCEFLFQVFEGASMTSAPPANAPILKMLLKDASTGDEGYHTANLQGSGYQNGYSGSFHNLVYVSTLTTSLTISKAGVSPATSWVLPDDTAVYSGAFIDRVWMRSDAGESRSSEGVNLYLSNATPGSPVSSLVVPRTVNGAPIRELEIVYKALHNSSNEYRYLKQRFNFTPVIQSGVTARMFLMGNQIGAGSTVNDACSSWQLKAFSGGIELPAASGSSVDFGVGNLFNADGLGSIYYSLSGTSGELNINNAKAAYRTLDGTFITPASAWVVTVITGGTCTAYPALNVPN